MVIVFALLACFLSLIALIQTAVRNIKRDALTIVLSSIGLISGFLALAISSPRDISQLGIDYLGIIVAILAAFSTLLLGMQLYHVFRLKEDADEVHKAKEGIEKYSEKLEEIKNQITNAKADISELNNIVSDLYEKSEHALYIDEDGPCDDK